MPPRHDIDIAVTFAFLSGLGGVDEELKFYVLFNLSIITDGPLSFHQKSEKKVFNFV